MATSQLPFIGIPIEMEVSAQRRGFHTDSEQWKPHRHGVSGGFGRKLRKCQRFHHRGFAVDSDKGSGELGDLLYGRNHTAFYGEARH